MEKGRHSYGTPIIKRWHDSDGDVTIGAFCSIGENVQIFTGGNHRTDWVSTFPFPAFSEWPEVQGRIDYCPTKGDVVIGNDVWLGNDCLILSGVTIGDGAVIGARAVVAKDVSPYGIAVGNPATVKHLRFASEVVEKLMRIKWWEWSDDKIREYLPDILSSDVRAFIRKVENAY